MNCKHSWIKQEIFIYYDIRRISKNVTDLFLNYFNKLETTSIIFFTSLHAADDDVHVLSVFP